MSSEPVVKLICNIHLNNLIHAPHTVKWVLKWQILVTEKLIKDITKMGYEIKKTFESKNAVRETILLNYSKNN